MKTSVPAAPNVRLGLAPVSTRVPGAAAGSVAAAPILMTPFEPALAATLALTALTVALFAMVNAPLPEFPTVRVLEFTQEEPIPSTVTVPVAFALEPMVPTVLETTPPPVTPSLPLPEKPTDRSLPLFHLAPVPFTVTVPTLPVS
ncbi:hypothetical protein D3C86_1768100 [compost metagenome]